MRFTICTLGCKTNQYESQAMAKLLQERNHQEVPSGEPTDAFIINTCSVTAVSDKKSRQTIRAVRKNNPLALVAVCGCYAQMSPKEVHALSVDLVGGTGNHLHFIQELESLWQAVSPAPRCLPYDNPRTRQNIEMLPSGGLEGRTRSLLKIQDGCENFCTYCIIPYSRGTCRSLSLEDSASSIHDLIAQGYCEIILTGIEISSWGKDFPEKKSLLDFLEMADKLATEYLVKQNKQILFRLGSLEPRTITEEFCTKAKEFSSLQPHFHLSLQSGCDTVLKRMNRKYDTKRFYESVTLLRAHFTNPAITTDLIVGFPAETEDEFAQTLTFLEKCQFSSMHIFPYSPREGTPAAKMQAQILKPVKETRGKQAKELALQMTHQYQQQFIGETLEVLFESQKNQYWVGTSPQHISVFVESLLPLQNQQRKVHIINETELGLFGALVPEEIKE